MTGVRFPVSEFFPQQRLFAEAYQKNDTWEHGWPSGLRRQTQDLMGESPRGFEPHSVQLFAIASFLRPKKGALGFEPGTC